MKFSSSSRVLRGCGRSSGRVIKRGKGVNNAHILQTSQYTLQFSLGSGYIAFVYESRAQVSFGSPLRSHPEWNYGSNAGIKTADSTDRSFFRSRRRRSGRALPATSKVVVCNIPSLSLVALVLTSRPLRLKRSQVASTSFVSTRGLR